MLRSEIKQERGQRSVTQPCMHLIKIQIFTHTGRVTKYSPYEICMYSVAELSIKLEILKWAVACMLRTVHGEDLQKFVLTCTSYHQVHDCEYHSVLIACDHLPIV